MIYFETKQLIQVEKSKLAVKYPSKYDRINKGSYTN